MSYQVECGECGKEILIEDLGVEVACPHCDTTLILTAEDVGEVEAEVTEEPSAEEKEAVFDFNFTDHSNAEQNENGSDSGVASAILTKDEAEAAENESAGTDAVVSDSTPNFDFLNQATSEAAPASQPNFNFSNPPSAETEQPTEATSESSDPSESAISEEEESPETTETESSKPNFDFLRGSEEEEKSSVATPEQAVSEELETNEAAESSEATNEMDPDDDPSPDSTPNFDFLKSASKPPETTNAESESNSGEIEEATPEEESAHSTDEETAEPEETLNIDSASNEETEQPPTETVSESESHEAKDNSSSSSESEEIAAQDEAKKEEIVSETETASEEESQEPQEERPITQTASFASRNRGPSPKVFQALVSYSILITIMFCYLLYAIYRGPSHQLESLPDIAPPEELQLRLIRENAQLAPGHTLKLNESRRFGNIKVTPLEVTREKIEFEHFQGENYGTSEATAPVLKLWVEIENVSEDQEFPPLDVQMLTLREHDPKDYDRVYANNWVCKKSDLETRDNRVLMYNHPPTSEFDMKGFVNRPLKPNEKVTTFLPTQEGGLGALEGDLVWRFQIRKGFHPQTMNGVTTLVEVEFSAEDI